VSIQLVVKEKMWSQIYQVGRHSVPIGNPMGPYLVSDQLHFVSFKTVKIPCDTICRSGEEAIKSVFFKFAVILGIVRVEFRLVPTTCCTDWNREGPTLTRDAITIFFKDGCHGRHTGNLTGSNWVWYQDYNSDISVSMGLIVLEEMQ